MGLQRTLVHQYAAAPAAVVAVLVDPDFLQRRAEQSGERNVEVSVERAGDTAAIRLARDLTVELPRPFNRLYKPTQRVTEEVHWSRQADVWTARFVVQAKSSSGSVRGSIRLTPTPGGTAYESSFEVISPLPFASARLEGLVADQVERVLRAMLDGSERELANLRARASGPREASSLG